MDGNNVAYTYHPGGRIESITDGTGHRKLGYDALGNLVHEDRYIAIPNSANVLAFHTEYTYDSWGRMRTLRYPDGEQVTYTYRWGGDLFSVHGTKGADSCRYVDSIAYNAYGQRAYIHYGNGTMASYTYDALHRLIGLESSDSLGNTMQKIKYAFDQASNITDIANNAPNIGPLGGRYENYYKYDPLHRLTRAGGSDQYGFEQAFELSPAGRPLSMSTNGKVKHYAYGEHTPPHAPQRIMVEEGFRHTLHDLRWDPAGNLGQVSTLAHDRGDVQSRFLFWTEDSRLHTVVDDRHHSYYAYDHAGGSCGSRAQSQACLSYAEMQQRRRSQRTLKVTGHSHQLDVNAWLMHTVSSLRQFTVYPSPYVVLSNYGYTKHYYAGTERLAARQGGGFGRTILGESTELAETATRLFDQTLHQAPQLATPPEPHLRQEGHLDALYNFMMKDIEIPENLDVHAEIEMEEFLHAMQNLAAADPEPDVYFYHSDHLGSASWITDKDGTPVQHLQYLPYGEPYIDQRAAGTTYRERFRFTGKERDEETGYGYFGARYMDHELMTMWLSVDPLADKYPSISPYNYCAWNPIKLVDPDGNEAWKPDENRNLVAEKGDNAWTLATYLNTTPEIATNMLEEQGYSVNSKGVLNLREGDVFEIDHGTIEAHSDIDLGKTGNFIRQKAGSGIAKDLFTNFWNGEGDITLTGSQFAGILMYIKESNQSPTESDSKSKLINFYDSQEYSLAFGSATVTLDGKQRITGFKDIYDFDPKKLGQRALKNEIKTRAVAAASNIIGNGKKFKVSYP